MPRRIDPPGCWCATCFPIDGASVGLTSAKWQDVKAAVTDPALNNSGDEFTIRRIAHRHGSREIVAYLKSEDGQRTKRRLWSWYEKEEGDDERT